MLNDTGKTEVSLRTISDISDEKIKFFIDSYQRGYRWTKTEVKDLLNDIKEFIPTFESSPTRDKFYCLQPIIVTKYSEENTWKVIDGQQRLTTLYLIFIYYRNVAKKSARKELPFELHYKGESKQNIEKCFAEIRDNEYWLPEELETIIDQYEDDIDCFFILNAYKEICTFFKKLTDNPHTEEIPDDMKKIFNNYLKIIWYELFDCDEQMEISQFTKINMGKIPLTNAELIKALLLKTNEKTESTFQDNIAIKWDEMEAQLSESMFWSFLVNDDAAYSTRIDFLFEIMAQEFNEEILKTYSQNHPEQESLYIEKANNKQYFSFHVFNNYVRLLKDTEQKADYIKNIWKKINEYYQMFRDWYQNRKWYHMIGYIIETFGSNYIDELRKITNLYRVKDNAQIAGHKTIFEQYLRTEIINHLGKGKTISKTELEEYSKELDYEHDYKKIKELLLLHNICSLELLEKETDARFPFYKYKDKDIHWDIEHINAVADERPNDNEKRKNDENACLVWLKNTKPILSLLKTEELAKLKLPDGQELLNAIDNVITNELYLAEKESDNHTFNSIYEIVINYFNDSTETDNSLANLTLLDAGTNRSYKNNIFPLKRKKILENCAKDIYIPLCTRNVFLKAYKQSDNLLRWTQNDKEEYINDIIDRISTYLKLENN